MKNIIYLILATALFISCESDHELSKSVLIYDTEFKDLPEYSEWGYNTFGAYYDRKVFISNNYEIPLKIISSLSTTSFIFNGELNSPSDYQYYSSNYYGEMSLKLTLNNFNIENYTDLLVLNDSIIDLTQPDCNITVTIDNDIFEATVIRGEFEFKKVQNLIVDDEPTEIIMSGTFDFQVLINEEPISISEGRFDIGVGEDNFFIIN